MKLWLFNGKSETYLFILFRSQIVSSGILSKIYFVKLTTSYIITAINFIGDNFNSLIIF